jgi:hypothetical protein
MRRFARMLARIPSHTVLGRTARLPLRLIPRTSTVRIPSGTLRGWKWIVGSGVRGYWLGTYEVQVQEAVARTVTSGGVIRPTIFLAVHKPEIERRCRALLLDLGYTLRPIRRDT